LKGVKTALEPPGGTLGVTTAGVITKVAVATALAGIPGKTAIAFTVAFEVNVNGLVYNVEPAVGTLPLVV
jgi:hypothetical protein